LKISFEEVEVILFGPIAQANPYWSSLSVCLFVCQSVSQHFAIWKTTI